MMRTPWLRVLPALLLVASACDPRDPVWTEPLRVEGPVVAGSHLVWIDRTTERLVLVDTDAEVEARRIALSPRPRGMAVAGDRVLVAAGRGSDPRLDVVPVAGGETVHLDLEGEAYDRVFVAPGARHAVLTHAMHVQTLGGPAARNLNRIAVVDLAASPPRLDAVLLRTESLAPQQVVFSADGTRAAVILEAAIAIVDLFAPERFVRIPLRLTDGQRLRPQEAIFSPLADYLYVRAAGTPDLLVLELGEREEGLTAAVNFLFVPGALALEAIAVPEGPGFEGHVAALFRRSGDAVAALLHASGDSSLGRQVEVSQPASGLLDLGEGRFLVHGVRGSGGEFTRWIAGWEPSTGRLEEREVQGPYVERPRVAGGHAFFNHRSVTVPDLGTMPAITGVQVDPSGAWLRVRPSGILLLGPATASVADNGGGTYFVAVDVPRKESGAAPDHRDRETGTTGAIVAVGGPDLAIDGLVLDDSIAALGIVGDHLFAVHDRIVGDVTLIPRNDLSREAARRYDGLLLAGLLQTRESR
jgi:hypothetical protein